MQVPNITQFVKSYLSDRPELLKKYVGVGVVTANYALMPVNALMRHLILVQGLNPDVSVQEMFTPQFTHELSRMFDHMHTSHSNREYDHEWATQMFAKAKEKINLTREQFDIYTDVSKLDDPPKQVEKPVFVSSPTLEKIYDDMIEVEKKITDLDIPSLRELNPVNELADALDTLSKVADTIEANPVDATLFLDEEPSPDPKELFSRTDHLRNVKKTIEQYGSVSGKLDTAGDRANYRAKLARATDLANEMVTLGLCTADSVKDQIEQIMKFPDDAFHALQRLVHTKAPVAQKLRNSSAGNGKARAHKKVPTTKVVKKSKRGSFTRSPRQS